VRPTGSCTARPSMVYHRETGLLRACPSLRRAARYHSLLVRAARAPQRWRSRPWTEENDESWGWRNGIAPGVGVQFHPESV
jgi:anthranilate synthase component 2